VPALVELQDQSKPRGIPPPKGIAPDMGRTRIRREVREAAERPFCPAGNLRRDTLGSNWASGARHDGKHHDYFPTLHHVRYNIRGPALHQALFVFSRASRAFAVFTSCSAAASNATIWRASCCTPDPWDHSSKNAVRDLSAPCARLSSLCQSQSFMDTAPR